MRSCVSGEPCGYTAMPKAMRAAGTTTSCSTNAFSPKQSQRGVWISQKRFSSRDVGRTYGGSSAVQLAPERRPFDRKSNGLIHWNVSAPYRGKPRTVRGCLLYGAAGRSRTDMRLLSQVLETCVSANSTTAAFRIDVDILALLLAESKNFFYSLSYGYADTRTGFFN